MLECFSSEQKLSSRVVVFSVEQKSEAPWCGFSGAENRGSLA